MAAGTEEMGGADALALKASAARALFAVFLLALPCFMLASAALSLETQVAGGAALLVAAIFLAAFRRLATHPHRAFGYANGVTAVRAAMTGFVAAAVLFADAFGARPDLDWTVAGVVLAALALDGVDGYLARRFGHASAFGARFDMEVDAFLILVLSLAAALSGKAGFWVLAIGAMRYLFVAAQRFVPALNGELPPSFRRKFVCVLQVTGLGLLVLPVLRPPVSTGIALLLLAALAASFAADIVHLLTRAGPHSPGRGKC